MSVATFRKGHDSVEGSYHEVTILNFVTESRLQPFEISPLCFFLGQIQFKE
jgi:hypothetical protein